MPATFRVLFVCTGNICRSPLAERMFRARLTSPPDLSVEVSSAGTGALEGKPIDKHSARALEELGLDPAGHVARWAEEAELKAADLILTASREHRERVLTLHPVAFRRTFTMKEFARLGRSLEPADRTLHEIVKAVAGRRGQERSVPRAEDDIADPYRLPPEVARACAQEISVVVDDLLDVLGLAKPRG